MARIPQNKIVMADFIPKNTIIGLGIIILPVLK